MKLYGIEGVNIGYVDVSKTLQGAKNYATRNGYDAVYSRSNGGYHVVKECKKVNGKWLTT